MIHPALEVVLIIACMAIHDIIPSQMQGRIRAKQQQALRPVKSRPQLSAEAGATAILALWIR